MPLFAPLRVTTPTPLQLCLSWRRCVATLVLLLLIVWIAVAVHDNFIRPFIGDVLIVIWMYLCVSSCVKWSVWRLAGALTCFAFLVEVSQYFQLLYWFDPHPHRLLVIIFGATFDWLDLVAYALGGSLSILIDRHHRP